MSLLVGIILLAWLWHFYVLFVEHMIKIYRMSGMAHNKKKWMASGVDVVNLFAVCLTARYKATKDRYLPCVMTMAHGKGLPLCHVSWSLHVPKPYSLLCAMVTAHGKRPLSSLFFFFVFLVNGISKHFINHNYNHWQFIYHIYTYRQFIYHNFTWVNWSLPCAWPDPVVQLSSLGTVGSHRWSSMMCAYHIRFCCTVWSWQSLCKVGSPSLVVLMRNHMFGMHLMKPHPTCASLFS